MSVIAPYILQLGRIEPYISLNELKYSATASALDFTNLVANGDTAANDRALYELIVRASSKIDAFCMGKLGTLNATENTEGGRYRMDRKGRFLIHPDFTPVIEVSAFAWGPLIGQTNSVPISSTNCFIERDTIIMQAYGAAQTNQVAGMQAFSWVMQMPYDDEFYVQYTYVNGYPNTFTTASAAAGASSIVVTDSTGLYPSMQIQIWDGMNDEYIQIAATYDGESLTIPLVNPLTYAHGIGTNVSAIPAAVKQACIHFVVGMVKQRGQGGIMLDEMGASVPVSGKIEMSAEDEVAGYDLLDPYRVVWGRT
jgi:hypothetical protein